MLDIYLCWHWRTHSHPPPHVTSPPHLTHLPPPHFTNNLHTHPAPQVIRVSSLRASNIELLSTASKNAPHTLTLSNYSQISILADYSVVVNMMLFGVDLYRYKKRKKSFSDGISFLIYICNLSVLLLSSTRLLYFFILLYLTLYFFLDCKIALVWVNVRIIRTYQYSGSRICEGI